MNNVVKIPYLYFMDTSDLADLCPVLGQTNVTAFDIIYDDAHVVSVIYKPADIVGCTRSLVFFSQAQNKVDGTRYFSRLGWKYPEAHMFYVSDPFYNHKGSDDCRPYYMSDFKSYVPLIHPILLKFHQLLGIAFCKIIGSSVGAYGALQFSAIFEEIAPWTLTLALNPLLSVDKTPINFDKIKAKVAKGKHLFFVAQNQLDAVYYKESFLNYKTLMQANNVQGWTFKTPASTFYNTNISDHHNLGMEPNVVFDFIDWMSYNKTASNATISIYNLKREF